MDISQEELAYTGVSQLRRLIAAREVSPVEVVEAALSRIERTQTTLNAFITVCAEQARARAREAEAAVMRGDALGPLHGIPFSVKDNIPTEGVRTTYGSRIFENNVPSHDAVAVARAKAAGAVLIGKTTTPEFAFLGMTEAPLFGRTANAWRQDRTCGGSSGGAAVAVAAGLGTLAICTDAGGSARIPAACNGVVGFKQSIGLVPHDWAEDVFGNTQYVSAMGRTMHDTASLLDVIAGPHASDPNTLNRITGGYADAAIAEGDLSGLRISWRELLGNTLVAASVREACEVSLGHLRAMGAAIETTDTEFANQESLVSRINASARRAQYSKHLAHHRDIMCPKIVRQLEQVAELSGQDLWEGFFERTRLFKLVQSWFETADVIAMPTLARAALPIDQDFFGGIEIDGRPAENPRRAWYPYTIPFNATGHPALSIPCGYDADGLPVALQLVGRIGADGQLLRIGALLEQALALSRRPVIAE
jgi:aspartyl-tRNA(Asn)/glutamyl-tRNA(Gln) amidotransferase subunit A